MRIFVCVKHVAVLGDELKLASDGRAVDPGCLDYKLNEWDACATEEALRLRERLGGEVVALSVGDEQVEPALRRCLAMGADRAVRVRWGDQDAGDPFSVARALAAAIGPAHPELVVAGVQSADSVQAATGTALAELLSLPCVAVARRLECEAGAGYVTVQRELEGGLVDVVEVDLPALITIQTGINEPRYATLRAIKQAEQRGIEVLEVPAEGAPAYRVRRMFPPPKTRRAQILGGSAADIAASIAQIVRRALA